ncbi:MAG: ABC transporter, partial [Pseudomonadota bacterium]
MMNKRELARGAMWRQWDLHVHTPASFHWSGQKFDGDLSSDQNKKLVDDMIEAMNQATPSVFAIMDYWTFDGWFVLKQRLSDAEAPKLTKKVFPGIELRLSAPTDKRLNAHVIFSDDIADQHLRDFLSNLRIERIDRAISKDALVDLARATAADMLEKKGHKKDVVDTDFDDALLAGYKLAEINTESYKHAISSVPNEMAIGFMPYDTSDGLDEVKWEQHYA